MTTFEYDAVSGRLQGTTNALGESQNFIYDANGRLSVQGLPDGRIISYQYNSAGDVSQISANQKTLGQFEYLDSGLVSRIAFVKAGLLVNPVAPIHLCRGCFNGFLKLAVENLIEFAGRTVLELGSLVSRVRLSIIARF